MAEGLALKPKFTLREAITALVVVVVVIAIAVPMWRNHQLRVRRQGVMEAIRAVQSAQDEFFGKHARYANEAELDAAAPRVMEGKAASGAVRAQLTLRRSVDELTYSVIARALPREGETTDTRCVEMRSDQNGRRFATDSDGVDRSADCWR